MSSISKLILHPVTRQLVNDYISQPKHALIIKGDKGLGLFTVATAIAKLITSTHESVMVVQPTKGTIPIEEVRSLYNQTRSTRKDALAVVIDDADSMGTDAQNALLKLLEEPPKNVYFILTTHAPTRLLETILSRAESVSIRPVSREQSMQLIQDREITDESMLAKLLFLASGLPAELIRLISDQSYYDSQVTIMGDARRLLEEDRYGRLVLLKKYMADRIMADTLLLMLGKLLSFSLYRAVNDSSAVALGAVSDAMDAIAKNGNVRAQLLRLSDRLP